jgi:hypothetical protein
MDGRHREDGPLAVEDMMASEGRRIVDAAREQGVVLRVLGGLAVHEYCAGLAACRRDHLDLDMAALGRQTGPVIAVFGELGYEERVHVRLTTHAGQAQFVRDCVHGDGAARPRPHEMDRVDVFFDEFRLDHTIDLRARLSLHPYAIPLADTLTAKLQMHAPEPRDVRDAVMLLATATGEGTAAGEVDSAYIGRLCAHDWGLFHDVSRNLQRCAEALDGSGLGPAERARATGLLARVTGAVDAAPKTLAWRLRARVGVRRRWWNTVEEQEGSPSGDAP